MFYLYNLGLLAGAFFMPRQVAVLVALWLVAKLHPLLSVVLFGVTLLVGGR